MTTLPYPYYYYGSADSLDQDVIIAIPRQEMPLIQEDRKIFLKNLEKEYSLDWNSILAVIENGYVQDTIYPKSWIDTLNNSLYHTYSLHTQVYPHPLVGTVPRNKLLAIYKAIRTCLSLLTRTHLRTQIRPILNAIHPFAQKIEALRSVNWLEMEDFQQKNVRNVDIWKTIAFYLGQNWILLEAEIEIYTKQDLLFHFPALKPFLMRETLCTEDKIYLAELMKNWLQKVEAWGEYRQEGYFLSCKEERINAKNECFNC